MSIQISITVKDSYSLNTGKPEIKHKFVISPSSHNELVLAFNKAISILFPSLEKLAEGYYIGKI